MNIAAGTTGSSIAPPGIGSTATASQKPCCFEALEIKELSHQPNLDHLLNLLTLPVQPESELAASSQQILASSFALRQLNRRCGPLTGATTTQIQALAVEKLEALARSRRSTASG